MSSCHYANNGMILTSIELTNMRNYPSLDFRPVQGLNVLLGNNAQGKSNLLEAIAMLGIGKSFRTSRESELIHEGRSAMVVTGEARTRNGAVRLSCGLTNTIRGVRKAYTLNGEAVRHASFLGKARIVTFTPADTQLIDGAPTLRRTFLNTALAQENQIYYTALAEYSRASAQKNALLRERITPDKTLLDTYDERLIEFGSVLMLERTRYINEIASVAASAAQRIDEGKAGEFSVAYCPNVPSASTTREEIRTAFTEQLARRRNLERVRAQALVGPHRDDLSFTLGGKSLTAFGSQGQRRTAVLALKIAEYTVMRNHFGEAPLLLLDDVLSELDTQRQGGFLESLGTIEQVFITSATAIPGTAAATHHIKAAKLTKVS
jgi:DNA replication and repair protein RecF